MTRADCLIQCLIRNFSKKLPNHCKGYIPCGVEDILREIDAALERLGVSARAASIRAQGAPEMIRDMRRGHVPSVQRLRSLCEVLDLEFYVGPSRKRWDDEGDWPDVPLRRLERTAQDLVQLTVDAGGTPISDDLLSVLIAKRAGELMPSESESTVLDLRRYNVTARVAPKRWGLGPPLEARIAPDWPVELCMGMGSFDPESCELVKIRDEYMEPELPNGCTVLVDHLSTDWQPPRIMAVRIDEEVIARQAAVSDNGRPLLASNHPDWPVAPLPASATVVGEVRWVSFWLDQAASGDEQVEGAPVLTLTQEKGQPD